MLRLVGPVHGEPPEVAVMKLAELMRYLFDQTDEKLKSIETDTSKVPGIEQSLDELRDQMRPWLAQSS